MITVNAIIAAAPTNDYPFAVVVKEDNRAISQEILVRSRRDALLTGNGVIHGLLVSGTRNVGANVVFDPRIEE